MKKISLASLIAIALCPSFAMADAIVIGTSCSNPDGAITTQKTSDGNDIAACVQGIWRSLTGSSITTVSSAANQAVIGSACTNATNAITIAMTGDGADVAACVHDVWHSLTGSSVTKSGKTVVIGNACTNSTAGAIATEVTSDGSDVAACVRGVWHSMTGGEPLFTGWTSVGSSGTATSDAIIVAVSSFNTTVSGQTSGVQRFYINGRDKYGVGSTSGTMPVMKGETWAVDGAQSVWMLSIRSN